MSAEWYYSSKGGQCGPVSFTTLAQLANSGNLAPTEYVWTAGMSNWAPASTITALFPTPPPIESTTRDAEPKRIPLQYPVASKRLKPKDKNGARSPFLFLSPMILVAIAGGGIAIGWYLHSLRPKTPIQRLADTLSEPNQTPFPIPDLGSAFKTPSAVQI